MNPCLGCKNVREIPGNSHIGCANSPAQIVHIGSWGHGHSPHDRQGAPNFCSSEERQAFADKAASERVCVVRCLWPGCGHFPLSFDAGGIFACSNREESCRHCGDSPLRREVVSDSEGTNHYACKACGKVV